jgi:hypothetical protein
VNVNEWTYETYSDGVLPTSEGLLKMSPKYQVSPARGGVTFVHGAGSDATYCQQSYGRQGELTTQVIAQGYNAIAGDNAGPQTWGNANSIARLDTNIGRLFAEGNVATNKYAMIFGSMGGIVSINYAAQAAVKPSCIIGVIPVLNPQDIRDNNRSGYGPSIDAAYNGHYDEPTMGAFYNPWTMRSAAKLKNIPMLIFYGATDALCLPQFATDFIAADPTYRTGVSLPYGHQEEAYASVDHQMVIDFLNTHMG